MRGRFFIDQVEQSWVDSVHTVNELSNQEYHQAPGASNSFLWSLSQKTMRHATGGSKSGSRPAPHFSIGLAVNDYVLHPGLFQEQYAVASVKTRSAKAFKMCENKYPDRRILTISEWEEVEALSNALLGNPRWQKLMENQYEPEPSFFGEYDGMLVKCRPDVLLTESNVVVDLKTARDASPRPFAWSVANYGYHQSVALTKRTVAQHTGSRPRFLFCVVGKDDPSPENVAWYELSEEYEEAGEERLFGSVSKLRNHLESGEIWYGYPERVTTLHPPWKESAR